MTVDFDQYPQSRISPFDAEALRRLMGKFSSRRKGFSVLEIGSWLGAGSTQIFAEYADRIVCVDHWEGSDTEEHRQIISQVDPYSIFQSNIASFEDKVTAVLCDSSRLDEQFEDGTFDFIFIDGDHRYAQTKSDIEVCLPILRQDGIICGHSCEGHLNPVNEPYLKGLLEVNHIDSIFRNFRHCHPGVIVAVHETLDDFVLFADDEKYMEIRTDDGIIYGNSSIWFKSFL